MVEVPAVGAMVVQNPRNRGVCIQEVNLQFQNNSKLKSLFNTLFYTLGNYSHCEPRIQGNGRGREGLNARVGWAEFFANIEEANIMICN